MASTIIQPTADALAATLAAADLTVALKTYRWTVRDLDRVPAAVIELPDLDRNARDEPERELGSNDWGMIFPVTLYFDLSEPVAAQEQAAETVEKVIAAIDADYTLGGVVENSKIVSAEPSYDYTDQARPLLAYACEAHVIRHVPT